MSLRNTNPGVCFGNLTVMLLSPLPLREITLRNRIGVSPMCQYSSQDGFFNDWHLVHLGSRAVGGAGIVFTEATAVEPRGRISPWDTGIWKDEHVEMLARIAAFLRSQGAVPGIQLAHAGRKASTQRPWEGGKAIPESAGGWETLAPSPIPFRDGDPAPHELTRAEIKALIQDFVAAAKRALQAGFETIEIHGAHGYLIHEFLSPLSNHRSDEYGGSLATLPARLPLFCRVSATDWVDGGWALDDSVVLARELKSLGVDVVDCSSGGNSMKQKIEIGTGYQVPFAERIRRDAGVATATVGMITSAAQADTIVRTGQADMVLLAREFLRDPYFPIHTALELGAKPPAPVQYARAF
jgi:2,4-dienoyl-CoA reductase-like NADH-dependent reductase (Old Yellow Enzyme family)